MPLIDGNAISLWINGHKIDVLVLIFLGWLAYTIMKNKEQIEHIYSN